MKKCNDKARHNLCLGTIRMKDVFNNNLICDQLCSKHYGAYEGTQCMVF